MKRGDAFLQWPFEGTVPPSRYSGTSTPAGEVSGRFEDFGRVLLCSAFDVLARCALSIPPSGTGRRQFSEEKIHRSFALFSFGPLPRCTDITNLAVRFSRGGWSKLEFFKIAERRPLSGSVVTTCPMSTSGAGVLIPHLDFRFVAVRCRGCDHHAQCPPTRIRSSAVFVG